MKLRQARKFANRDVHTSELRTRRGRRAIARLRRSGRRNRGGPHDPHVRWAIDEADADQFGFMASLPARGSGDIIRKRTAADWWRAQA